VRCPGGVGGTRLISVNIKLTDIGVDLQKLVAEKLETSSSRVKLIANGKVLDLFKTMDAQNVKNNQQLMALLLTESEEEAEKEDKMYDKLRKIREDALTLINSNKDRGFMHVIYEKLRLLILKSRFYVF
jgi:Ubiquitin-like domain